MNKVKHFINTPLFEILVLLGLMFSFVLYQVSFGSSGVLSSRLITTGSPVKWFLLWCVKFILIVSTDSLILWLFIQLRSLGGQLKSFFHGWLFFVAAGVCFTIILSATGSGVGLAQLLNALLPVVRNSSPFLTGILIVGLAMPYLHIEKNFAQWQVGIPTIVLLSMFGRDIWGFSNGFGLFAALIFGVVALLPVQAQKHATFKHAMILMGLGIISILIMGEFSRWSQVKNLSGAGQMVGLVSLFTLIPARLLLSWAKLDQVTLPRPARVQFTLSGFLLIFLTVTVPYAMLLKNVQAFFTGLMSTAHGLWIIATAIASVLLVIGVTAIIHLLLVRTRAWKLGDRLGELQGAALLRLNGNQLKSLVTVVWRYIWPTALAFVSFYLIQFGSTLFSYPTLSQDSFGTVLGSIVPTLLISRFSGLFFGIMILMSLFWILRALTGNFWFAYLSTDIVTLIWGVANAIKVRDRSEAILPADLYELTAIDNLVKMVSPALLIGAIIGIVVLILVGVLFAKRFKPSKLHWSVRIFQLVLSALFLYSFFSFNQPNAISKTLATNYGVQMSNANELWMAQANGPYTEFARALDVTVMTKPRGYSEATIDGLVKKYFRVADQINETRTNQIDKATVVFNLSESFSDPSRVPNLTLNQDPMPYIRKMESNTTSGLMMSFGYGGGTANMEWETLTGLSLGNLDKSLTTPYNQLVMRQKKPGAINNQFNYSAAIHPYLASFYNRKAVYNKFGFNKFMNIESKSDPIRYQLKLGKSPYLSDQTAYNNALAQINAHGGGQFINLVTMQNHMPYTAGEYGNSKYKVSGTAIKDETTKGSFETYAQGLNYTDTAAKDFAEKIDKIKKPIIWVFYGDHLAALYNGDDTIAKYAVQLHQTDYFVYANKYAREHGAQAKLSGDNRQVGSSDFIALAYAQANAKVNPFVALLTKTQEDLPTIWTRSESTDNVTDGMTFVTKNGKRIPYVSLTKKQRSLLHDYQLIEYDIVAGKQYSLKAGIQHQTR